MAIPSPRPFNEAEHAPKLSPGIGVKNPIACYPPRLEKIEILGYVDDASNIGYSRDIGRSAILKGRVYYMFGDTFCKNKKGEFIGIQSTTSAAVLDKSQPLSSTYLTRQEDELVDNFVPLTEAEHRQEKIVWRDNTRPRVTLWAFGGMLEIRGAGWLWYQKGVIYEEEGNEENKYHGTGIARVEADNHGRLTVHRFWPEMFNADEPRVGTFSSIVEGDYVYLWGDHGAGYGDGIILSRVRKDWPQDKNCYSYWNGNSYVADWRDAEPVFGKMQSGAIIKTCLFGEERPWVFVGCTAWGDSKLMLGASATLEGPFDEKAICTAQGIDYPETIMYCMYPHTWALDEKKGELLVTWSEQWPGGVVGSGRVIAAKVQLAMNVVSMFARIPLQDYSKTTQESILPAVEDYCRRHLYRGIGLRLEGRFVAPGVTPPPDVMARHLRVETSGPSELYEAISVIEHQLADLEQAGGRGGGGDVAGGERALWLDLLFPCFFLE